MDTEPLKHIDWTNDATYKDLSGLLLALKQGFESADVTSGTNGLVDGYVKRGILERIDQLAQVFDNTEHWLIVRQERNYTAGQGKANN